MTASDYPKREADGLVHLHPDPFTDELAAELWLTFGMNADQVIGRSPADYVNEAISIANALRESFTITPH